MWVLERAWRIPRSLLGGGDEVLVAPAEEANAAPAHETISLTEQAEQQPGGTNTSTPSQEAPQQESHREGQQLRDSELSTQSQSDPPVTEGAVSQLPFAFHHIPDSPSENHSDSSEQDIDREVHLRNFAETFDLETVPLLTEDTSQLEYSQQQESEDDSQQLVKNSSSSSEASDPSDSDGSNRELSHPDEQDLLHHLPSEWPGLHHEQAEQAEQAPPSTSRVSALRKVLLAQASPFSLTAVRSRPATDHLSLRVCGVEGEREPEPEPEPRLTADKAVQIDAARGPPPQLVQDLQTFFSDKARRQDPGAALEAQAAPCKAKPPRSPDSTQRTQGMQDQDVGTGRGDLHNGVTGPGVSSGVGAGVSPGALTASGDAAQGPGRVQNQQQRRTYDDGVEDKCLECCVYYSVRCCECTIM